MSPAGLWPAGARLGRALVDILFPEEGCAVCGGPLPPRPGWEPEACPGCLEGIFAGADAVAARAPAGVGPGPSTLTPGPPSRPVITGGVYGGPLEKAVLRLKRVPDRRLARFLARLLAERLAEAGVSGAWDAIVPVPLHPVRLRERGFNQAEILARELAGLLGSPMRADLCHRVRETPLQSVLARPERLTNVAGAFHALPGGPAPGGRVLVVDDVLTTGATAGEVARALRAAGAGEVWCCAAAHAL